ncbi:hypothetical protein R6Q57_017837 [Mikania cordata]
MEEIFENLPQHTCKWTKGRLIMYKYQGIWNLKGLHEGSILAQQNFKAQPTDVLLCSYPKTGTTWLKALSFAIATRAKYDGSSSPLLTTFPHECIPFLERDLDQIEKNHKNSCFPLVGTHIPYTCLPKSVSASNCKIVYIYRDAKDVLVSYYNFVRGIYKVPEEDAPFEEAFDEFCEGVSSYGSYWDHILGYWRASQERPGRVLFLKYEDMKRNATRDMKRLAEFIGYPFSVAEESAGAIENIIKLCSFENLSKLEVNKSGSYNPEDATKIETRTYFRKGKVGDWENYFTHEMKQKIDILMDEKLSDTGLITH